MTRFVPVLAIAMLMSGCKLVSSEGATLLKITPDHGFGCANYGDGPPDNH